MSSFIVDLWESIFTPGPTPTLVLATNATFGALQLLLLALLVFTSSIHFAILSVLCAGLWYSINWFAREVQAAKAAEDSSKSPSSTEKDPKTTARQISPDPTGSDTETEADAIPTTTTTGADIAGPGAQRRKPPPPQPGAAPVPPPTAPAAADPTPSSTLLQPKPPTPNPGLDGSQDLGQRRRSLGDSSDYVSTDSEWEKVSDQETK
ncbi:uncharacterized protein HMPREF1541_05908 [Cyphellophora europaea CBS 101466]|uniref:Pkr1-domain-containing protein n=1 Tax=Cyphellophora europaea (strain CBS 101466) TaxID=1220924 RepID=W2RT97_CYPE1|nr:uncharacterized protein HMPREF1541_05908 [Cyphellophora europaea CBS 101466]ETN39682.1 hypothetical protein HMPREF1541_05908 [Cyphellophora europaea CBS 101466]